MCGANSHTLPLGGDVKQVVQLFVPIEALVIHLELVVVHALLGFGIPNKIPQRLPVDLGLSITTKWNTLASANAFRRPSISATQVEWL
jgi:hypothetical protein